MQLRQIFAGFGFRGVPTEVGYSSSANIRCTDTPPVKPLLVCLHGGVETGKYNSARACPAPKSGTFPDCVERRPGRGRDHSFPSFRTCSLRRHERSRSFISLSNISGTGETSHECHPRKKLPLWIVGGFEMTPAFDGECNSLCLSESTW